MPNQLQTLGERVIGGVLQACKSTDIKVKVADFVRADLARLVARPAYFERKVGPVAQPVAEFVAAAKAALAAGDDARLRVLALNLFGHVVTLAVTYGSKYTETKIANPPPTRRGEAPKVFLRVSDERRKQYLSYLAQKRDDKLASSQLTPKDPPPPKEENKRTRQYDAETVLRILHMLLDESLVTAANRAAVAAKIASSVEAVARLPSAPFVVAETDEEGHVGWKSLQGMGSDLLGTNSLVDAVLKVLKTIGKKDAVLAALAALAQHVLAQPYFAEFPDVAAQAVERVIDRRGIDWIRAHLDLGQWSPLCNKAANQVQKDILNLFSSVPLFSMLPSLIRFREYAGSDLSPKAIKAIAKKLARLLWYGLPPPDDSAPHELAVYRKLKDTIDKHLRAYPSPIAAIKEGDVTALQPLVTEFYLQHSAMCASFEPTAKFRPKELKLTPEKNMSKLTFLDYAASDLLSDLSPTSPFVRTRFSSKIEQDLSARLQNCGQLRDVSKVLAIYTGCPDLLTDLAKRRAATAKDLDVSIDAVTTRFLRTDTWEVQWILAYEGVEGAERYGDVTQRRNGRREKLKKENIAEIARRIESGEPLEPDKVRGGDKGVISPLVSCAIKPCLHDYYALELRIVNVKAAWRQLLDDKYMPYVDPSDRKKGRRAVSTDLGVEYRRESQNHGVLKNSLEDRRAATLRKLDQVIAPPKGSAAAADAAASGKKTPAWLLRERERKRPREYLQGVLDQLRRWYKAGADYDFELLRDKLGFPAPAELGLKSFPSTLPPSSTTSLLTSSLQRFWPRSPRTRAASSTRSPATPPCRPIPWRRPIRTSTSCPTGPTRSTPPLPLPTTTRATTATRTRTTPSRSGTSCGATRTTSGRPSASRSSRPRPPRSRSASTSSGPRRPSRAPRASPSVSTPRARRCSRCRCGSSRRPVPSSPRSRRTRRRSTSTSRSSPPRRRSSTSTTRRSCRSDALSPLPSSSPSPSDEP